MKRVGFDRSFVQQGVKHKHFSYNNLVNMSAFMKEIGNAGPLIISILITMTLLLIFSPSRERINGILTIVVIVVSVDILTSEITKYVK